MILKYETLSTYLVGLVLDHNEAISSQYVDNIRPASLNFVNPIRTSYNEEPHAFKETYNSAY